MFTKQRLAKKIVVPKRISRCNTVLTNISAGFLAKVDTLILKFIWKCKGPRIAKTNKQNRMNNEDSQLLISKLIIKLQKSRLCVTCIRRDV